MTEFKENDVLAEIGNQGFFWIVSRVCVDGYYMDSFFDGKFHFNGTWISFRTARNHLVKVDEWDRQGQRMKEIDAI